MIETKLTFADIEPELRSRDASGDERCATNWLWTHLMLAEIDRLREAARPFASAVNFSDTVLGMSINDDTKLADYETVWAKKLCTS